MKKMSHEQKKFLAKAGIALLALLCVGAILWFVTSLQQSIKSGDLQPDSAIIKKPDDVHVTRMVTIESVRSWMTFDYLNVVFKMDPSFLKNALAITDKRYPNIRIDAYIREHKLDPQVFMDGVRQAITSYPTSK